METKELFQSLRKDYRAGHFDPFLDIQLDSLENLEPEEIFTAILKFRSLLKLGKIYDAKSMLKQLEDLSEESEFDRLLCMIKVDFLTFIGETNEVMSNIESVKASLNDLDQSSAFVDDLKLFVKVLTGRHYSNCQDYDLSFNYLNEAYYLLESMPNSIFESELFHCLIENSTSQGEFDTSRKFCEEYLERYDSVTDHYLTCLAMVEMINFLIAKTDLKTASAKIDELEQLNRGKHIDITWTMNNFRGIILQYNGDLPEARTLHSANLELAKQMSSELKIANSYNNLGNVNNLLGDIHIGLNYIFYSLNIIEQLGNKGSLSTAYNNIAINYMMLGDLDRALEYLLRSEELLNEINMQGTVDMATTMLNLGQTYQIKGELDKAEQYFQVCLEIDKKYNNDFHIAEDYYNLLTLDVERGSIEKASSYLKQIKEINEKTDNKIVELRYRLGKMQIYKSSKRTLQRAKAQEILQEIVNEDPVDFELYVFSLLNLCELLLIELSHTGEQEVLDEIKQYVDRLHEFASSQQSYIYLAESYLIKSKIAQMELDYPKSRRLIQQAEDVSINRGLDALAKKISLYHDDLLDEINSHSNRMDEASSSLKERLEEVKLDELFSQIRYNNNETELLPEKPTMFLIIENGGSTIYKKNFEYGAGINQDLIAGLFSALYSLSGEIFKTEASTQRIRHEDYTIITKPIQNSHLLFCYIFKGQSFTALKKLETVTNSIVNSKTIWSALNRDVASLTSMELSGMDLIIEELLLKT